MKTQQIAFASGSRQVKELRIHQPAGKPRVGVLIIHGMAEHYGRYEGLAQELAGQGFLTAGYDLMGHGPQTAKDALGSFGEPNGWQKLVYDIDTAHTVLRQRWPGMKVVLLGHSMGSFLAREYAIQLGQDLSGLVLSGSGWQPPGLCRFGLAVSSLQVLLGWREKPAKLLHHLNFSGNNRPFRPVRTPFDWLTRNQEAVDAYRADPYCGFPMQVGAYQDLFWGLLALTRLERLQAVPKALPVLFLSGTADPLAGKEGSAIHALAGQYRQAGLKDVTVKLYQDARHEVFNEINRDEVVADLLEWLRRVEEE